MGFLGDMTSCVFCLESMNADETNVYHCYNVLILAPLVNVNKKRLWKIIFIVEPFD